jgi:hypothetical protein
MSSMTSSVPGAGGGRSAGVMISAPTSELELEVDDRGSGSCRLRWYAAAPAPAMTKTAKDQRILR